MDPTTSLLLGNLIASGTALENTTLSTDIANNQTAEANTLVQGAATQTGSTVVADSYIYQTLASAGGKAQDLAKKGISTINQALERQTIA